MNYGYLGASWANQANANRKNATNQSQFQSQFLPQRQQQAFGRYQFRQQQGLNKIGERDKMFGFGINALTGLMK